ncbi:MAG: flagellar brake protein [Clostridium sp.]
MASLNLCVNNRIEILREDENFKSIVQDVNNEMFSINIPVSNGVYLPLQNGEEVNFFYYVDNGGCFKFDGKVIEKLIENNMHLYKISNPYNVKKIQRRSFVRVDTIEQTYYRVIKEDNDGKWNKGLVVDLSGGGLRFKIKDEVNLSDIVEINLIINDEKLPVKGEIVRIDRTEDKEFMCGINFIDLRERERDKIISKVFQLMRKQRGVL